MKCTNCGKMVPDSAKICGYCGHRLKSEIGPAAVFQTPSAGESNKKPRNRGITGLLRRIISGLLRRRAAERHPTPGAQGAARVGRSTAIRAGHR